MRRRPHTRLRQRVAFAVLVGCGLGLVAPAAAAATSLTWTGAVDSNWSTAGNWSPAQVPAAGDDVTLPFTGLREPRNNDLVGVQLRSVTISFRFALGGNAVELTSGGSLTFGTGAHLAAFSVVLHGPATIDGGDGGTIGNISGTGPLTFRGDSPSLVGAGSYSGATTIDGNITLFASDAIPAASPVTITGSGMLQLNEATQLASLAGPGRVRISSLDATTLTVGDATSTTFSGALEDGNAVLSLTKVGSGTQTLSGTNTYTGTTEVQDGELNVTGSIAGSVTVKSGATLRVSGTVGGSVTLESGGAIVVDGGTVTGGITSVPLAPTGVTAVAGDGQATVSFTAPADNGSPITSYTVTSSGGRTASGTTSPIVVSGLTNGTSTTFTVTATNSIGTGAASAASNAVTPRPQEPAPSDPAPASPEPPAPGPELVVALVDTRPPSAPGRLRARIAAGALTIEWDEGSDDVGVHHYELFRDGTLLAQVGEGTTTTLRAFGAGAFTLVSVDAAGNRSATSVAIRTARTARPAVAPKRVPAWAWKLLAWEQRSRRGVRPATPKPLPRWYARWRSWRQTPFRLAA